MVCPSSSGQGAANSPGRRSPDLLWLQGGSAHRQLRSQAPRRGRASAGEFGVDRHVRDGHQGLCAPTPGPGWRQHQDNSRVLPLAPPRNGSHGDVPMPYMADGSSVQPVDTYPCRPVFPCPVRKGTSQTQHAPFPCQVYGGVAVVGTSEPAVRRRVGGATIGDRSKDPSSCRATRIEPGLHVRDVSMEPAARTADGFQRPG